MDFIRDYWWLIVIVVAIVPGLHPAPAAAAGAADRQRADAAAHGCVEDRRRARGAPAKSQPRQATSPANCSSAPVHREA